MKCFLKLNFFLTMPPNPRPKPEPENQFRFRWTRYFYCSSLPSVLAEDFGWPQLSTSISDHVSSHGLQVKRNLRHDPGKSFKSTDTKLPPELRDRIVNMKLAHVKKAGTASHQRAAAASAWLSGNSNSGFSHATMAWTGAIWYEKTTGLSSMTLLLSGL